MPHHPYPDRVRHPLAGEARFRQLVDSISELGLFMLDSDGCILSWNSGAERLLGHAEADVLGCHLSMLYLPQDAAAGKPYVALERARADARHEETGWRLHKEGRHVSLRMVITRVYGARGLPEGFAVVLQEAVAQPGDDAQDARQYRAMVAALTDIAVVLVDANGLLQTWNPGAERIFGFTAEEVCGNHYASLFPRDDVLRGEPLRELAQVAETGRAHAEGWRLRAGGSVFWARTTLTTVHGEAGRPSGFVAVLQDLTETRRSEEGLRRSEERYRTLLDGVRDHAICMLDAEGALESWNSGALHLFGYDSFELAGQPCARLYAPDDVAAGVPQAHLVRAAREGRFEEEGWRQRADGSRFWAHDVLTPMRDDRGALRGYIRVLRDVSGQQGELQELRVINQRLARLARERGVALERETQRRRSLETQLQLELERVRVIVATLNQL